MTSIVHYGTVPALFVYLNTSVTNKTGNGTGYTILFDTVAYGTGYNSLTGAYTVPVAGTYLIATSILLTNITSGANGNLCTIATTGFSMRLSEMACTAAKDASLQFATNGMIIRNCAAGDTISIGAQLNNGSSPVVGVAGGTAPYNTWMYVKYLG